jgi:hypothetical protein
MLNMQIIFKHIVDLSKHISDRQQQSDRFNTEIMGITNSPTWNVLKSLKNNQLIYFIGHLLLNVLQTAKKILNHPKKILEKINICP